MQAVLDKKNGGTINNNNYTYTPPAEPAEESGDDLNSDTGIVEDVVSPEDDYVIGSDQLPGFGEENQEENTGQNNEGQENTEDIQGNGGDAVPNEYRDEYGHELKLVNK